MLAYEPGIFFEKYPVGHHLQNQVDLPSQLPTSGSLLLLSTTTSDSSSTWSKNFFLAKTHYILCKISFATVYYSYPSIYYYVCFYHNFTYFVYGVAKENPRKPGSNLEKFTKPQRPQDPLDISYSNSTQTINMRRTNKTFSGQQNQH